MIKVIYINKIDQLKQESDFQDQGELSAHELAYPYLYNPELYDVTVLDKTQEIQKQKNIDKYLKRIQFGQILMAELAAMNKASIDAGTLTSEQVLAIKQALAPVKDFVSEGSLGFALSALNSDSVLPLALKGYFVTKISNYVGSE